MIKRLNVKKNVRLLSVQWDGANISECVSFCRYCHFPMVGCLLCLERI